MSTSASWRWARSKQIRTCSRWSADPSPSAACRRRRSRRAAIAVGHQLCGTGVAQDALLRERDDRAPRRCRRSPQPRRAPLQRHQPAHRVDVDVRAEPRGAGQHRRLDDRARPARARPRRRRRAWRRGSRRWRPAACRRARPGGRGSAPCRGGRGCRRTRGSSSPPAASTRSTSRPVPRTGPGPTATTRSPSTTTSTAGAVGETHISHAPVPPCRDHRRMGRHDRATSRPGRCARRRRGVHARSWQAAYRGLVPDDYLRRPVRARTVVARWERGLAAPRHARSGDHGAATTEPSWSGFATIGPVRDADLGSRRPATSSTAIYLDPSCLATRSGLACC